jgi:type IV pilus assembly protein PilA
VVGILGILATLSIYGVRRYLASSKSAEALQNVGGMARAVHAAATRDSMSSALLASNEETINTGTDLTGSASGSGNGKGNGATVNHGAGPGLCDSASPVPSSMNSVKGRKYQPNHGPGIDYNAGDKYTGWRCLQFSIASPQYYQYLYKVGGPPVEVTLPHGGNPKGLSEDYSWNASAQGDIDGDGKTSWFVLEGYITDARVVVQGPAVGLQDPEE